VNLVVQGPTLTAAQAEELCRLAGKPAERISEKAFRLRGVDRSSSLAAWCEERRIDHAFVPEGRRFADLKLLAMDMDSTLITIECIDELGALAGKQAEVAAVTAQAMRGEIDYPESLRRRVAAIAGLPETSLLQVYEERLGLTAGAEVLLSKCREHGVQVLLVSGGFTFFTERLKARLGIDHTISNVLEVKGGKLSGALIGEIVDADAKARKFVEVMGRLKARKEETVAIGDGANDLKMMAEAGLSVAFRAKPVVRAQAGCALNWCGLDAVVNLFD
jgi:phosphoserine phosphatase